MESPRYCMKGTHLSSPLAAFLCTAMALLLAVTQPVLALVFAFLIPFWFFLALVVIAPYRPIRSVIRVLPFLVLPVFSPRPPPLR